MKYLFLRAMRKLRLLHFFNTQLIIFVGQLKVKIPVIMEMGLEHKKMSELWMMDVLKKMKPYLHPDSLFIDVGVNTGQTLIKSKAVGIELEYYGLEPNPYCVFYVHELIRLNQFKNTHIISAGAAQKASILPLYFYHQHLTDSAASIVSGFRDGAVAKYTIIVNRLEVLLEEVLSKKKIGIMKIDVEGFEYQVLKGAAQVIQASRPFILIEILPVYDVSNSARLTSQTSIENMLRTWNYRIFRIIKSKDNNSIAFHSLENLGLHGDLSLCDYLLVPIEKAIIF